MSESRTGDKNHLYGKDGRNHNCTKLIVPIFLNGNQIEAPSKNELSEIMKNEYHSSPSMINNVIKSDEPLNARYKKHEKAKGMIVRYTGA